MKKFDYSFLDNGLLPANLINITGTIYSLKAGAKIRQDEYEKILSCLGKGGAVIITIVEEMYPRKVYPEVFVSNRNKLKRVDL